MNHFPYILEFDSGRLEILCTQMNGQRKHVVRYYDCLAKNERQCQARNARGMFGAMLQPGIKGTVRDIRTRHSSVRQAVVTKKTEQPQAKLYLSYYPGRPLTDSVSSRQAMTKAVPLPALRPA